MARALLTACFLSGLLAPFGAAGAESRPTLALTVVSDRARYLLGDPVVLAGSLRNTGKEPIRECRADLPLHARGVDIFISADGVRFLEYRMGIYDIGKVERPLETLEPGQEWTFQLRVLYTFERPSHLAFERPGKHFVKLVYPLISRGGAPRAAIESNVVSIDVRAPEGADAEVWRQINTPDFLYFLQSGYDRHKDAKIPTQALELLRKAPKGGYAEGLRQGLREYYRVCVEERSYQGQFASQLEEIRQLLGIPKKKLREDLFPQDKRLDVEIRVDFPVRTQMKEVFQVISAQSGVTLRVAPDFELRSLQTLPHTCPLREFMDRAQGSGAVWLREDDGGYRLVPGVTPK